MMSHTITPSPVIEVQQATEMLPSGRSVRVYEPGNRTMYRLYPSEHIFKTNGSQTWWEASKVDLRVFHCSHFIRTGKCPRGVTCNFIHVPEHLRDASQPKQTRAPLPKPNIEIPVQLVPQHQMPQQAPHHAVYPYTVAGGGANTYVFNASPAAQSYVQAQQPYPQQQVQTFAPASQQPLVCFLQDPGTAFHYQHSPVHQQHHIPTMTSSGSGSGSFLLASTGSGVSMQPAQDSTVSSLFSSGTQHRQHRSVQHQHQHHHHQFRSANAEELSSSTSLGRSSQMVVLDGSFASLLGDSVASTSIAVDNDSKNSNNRMFSGGGGGSACPTVSTATEQVTLHAPMGLH
eukprot:PhM_4_TR10034/c0_g1_i10/m.38893